MTVAVVNINGVNHIGNVALAQCHQDFVAVILSELLPHPGANAVVFQVLGGALGGFDIKAQVVEATDQRQRSRLVLIRNGHQHRAVVGHMQPAGL